jgi:hypothetical protein
MTKITINLRAVKRVAITCFFFFSLVTDVLSQHSFSLGGDFSRGNVNVVNVDARAEIKNDSSNFAWSVSPVYRFTYLTLKKEVLNSEIYISSFLENKKKKWKFLTFNENERSYNRKIIYRGNLGVGFAIYVFREKNLSLSISEAVLPEIFVTETLARQTVRLSTRVKFQAKRDPFTLTSTTVVQPSILNSPALLSRDNFIMRSQNSFEVSLSARISFLSGVDILIQTYPSYLNTQVRPVDLRIYFSLKVKL